VPPAISGLLSTYGPRQDLSLLVEHAEGIVELAARIRPGGRDLLLCLHGLGCAKESFDSAFQAEPLSGLSICAFDFPGHGATTSPLPGYTLEAYAELTARVVELLSPERLFLVGHSMGGAVALVAGPDLARLASFVSIEGNLVAQDCGLVSRGAAGMPQDRFVRHEFPRFAAALAAAPEPALRAWASWCARADPVAFHQVATSLVKWSDSGKLLDLCTSLPRAAYIHGTGSGDLSYLLPWWDGLPVYPISGSGHFPMVDHPSALWQAVAEVVGNLDPALRTC
jgi:pimeloyl-ACP methyl ester carboxylesterase